jgi:exosortase/archaeosortase family protein
MKLTPARTILGLTMVALGVLSIVFEATARGVEATVAARLATVVTPVETVAFPAEPDPAVVYRIGGAWYALRITAECSVAFYIGGLLILGAAVSTALRLPPVRVLLAAVAGVAVLVLTNQTRILGLGLIRGEFGSEAFAWAHSLGGSLAMLLGVVVALMLFFAITVTRRARSEATT